MLYSDLYLKQRYTTPLFLILVLPIFVFFGWLYLQNTSLETKAGKKIIKELEIVNLNTNQAGVYWQTENKEISWIIYGEEGSLEKLVFDERDTETNKLPYFRHYVLLRNLKRNTKYNFKIVSDNQITANADGAPFTFNTPDNFTNLNSLKPAYGKTIAKNGSPLENVVVVLKIKDMYPLLTLTKPTGEWLIPMSSILEKKTNQPKTLSEKEVFYIEIVGENEGKTIITTDFQNINPIPQTITIGQDYNFTNQEKVLGETSYEKTSASFNKIAIIFPKEGAMIPDSLPLIKGIALPQEIVLMEIISQDPSLKSTLRQIYANKTKTDEKGIWKLVIPFKLLSGKYEIRMRTKDYNNKNVSLSKTFTIAKSGEQVLGQATAEAYPTLSRVATLIPTVQKEISPTQLVSPTPSSPVTGFNSSLITIASGTFIILGLALLLAF